ncbi:MAG: sialate O-acetylesterase, partial [Oscillospiraceae bacterium]
YPIGIVQTALGGTRLSLWNPNEDGILYFDMIRIIEEYVGEIKAILWYQGCSDALPQIADDYYERFMNMVSKLRTALRMPKLPVLTAQLNRSIAIGEDNDDGWAKVREAQRKAAHNENIYVVPTIDMTLSDAIHNDCRSNVAIGQRMAETALKNIYKFENILCSAPDIEDAVLMEGIKVELTFRNVYGELNYCSDLDKNFFTVSDNFGKIAVQNISADKNKMTITLEKSPDSNVFISGACEKNPTRVLPYDTFTRLPILAFYMFKVK